MPTLTSMLCFLAFLLNIQLLAEEAGQTQLNSQEIQELQNWQESDLEFFNHLTQDLNPSAPSLSKDRVKEIVNEIELKLNQNIHFSSIHIKPFLERTIIIIKNIETQYPESGKLIVPLLNKNIELFKNMIRSGVLTNQFDTHFIRLSRIFFQQNSQLIDSLMDSKLQLKTNLFITQSYVSDLAKSQVAYSMAHTIVKSSDTLTSIKWDDKTSSKKIIEMNKEIKRVQHGLEDIFKVKRHSGFEFDSQFLRFVSARVKGNCSIFKNHQNVYVVNYLVPLFGGVNWAYVAHFLTFEEAQEFLDSKNSDFCQFDALQTFDHCKTNLEYEFNANSTLGDLNQRLHLRLNFYGTEILDQVVKIDKYNYSHEQKMTSNTETAKQFNTYYQTVISYCQKLEVQHD